MSKFIDILYRRPFLLFILFLVAAYLPVFLPFFHLKNDLLGQNLPTRYVIGESLYSGYFPWWNPYINFGNPQYGDMNNGFWNPVMWLIAKSFGYNIWTITYEEMLYILIGGWGIYKVCRECGVEKGIAITSGLAYMSCGYVVGHLQYLCWITGTAFFPYVFLFFLRVNSKPILKNYIFGAISVFLFTSSTHPGLVIGALYFFCFAVISMFLFRNTLANRFYQPKFLLINLTFLILGMVFSVAVIASDLDVLGHISRGSKLNLNESLLAPTTFQSYISILFPLAVNKSSLFATDISMRNVFVGVACLAGFIFLFRYVNKKVLIVLLSALLFFIFLASGGIFKTIFYYILPFVGNVRLNGEFAYFAVLILILAGSSGLQLFIRAPNAEWLGKRLLLFLSILSVLAILIAITLMIVTSRPIVDMAGASPKDIKGSVKTFIDHLGFAQLLLLSALIQLITFLLVRRNLSSVFKTAVLVVLNLIVNTWLVLPFTGIGMKSKKQIDVEMRQSPRGLFIQELRPLKNTMFMDTARKGEFTLLGSYSKKIGYPEEEQYPVELKNTQAFFADSVLHHFINQQSYIFLSTDTTIGAETNFDSSVIAVNKFGAGCLQISVNNQRYRFITFLQNDYPYWQTIVNGTLVRHYTAFKTFVTIPLRYGRHEIKFVFNPSPIRKAIFVNGLIFLMGLICLMPRGLRSWQLFN